MTDAEELKIAAENLLDAAKRLDDPEFVETLAGVREVIKRYGKAWSGSWLGYHACVYYSGLSPPKPGDHFSQEWGLMNADGSGTGWRELSFDGVVESILAESGKPDLVALRKSTASAEEAFEQGQATVLSRLTHAVAKRKDDKFLANILKKAELVRLVDTDELLNRWCDKGQVMSRDMTALNAGNRTPPHLSVAADLAVIEMPYLACRELGKLANQASSHLSYEARDARQAERIGSRVFIGHGQSSLWKDLKDFIQDRICLPWDEFNRVPVAGVTNIARLAQMLDGAGVALLVMTAEDEQMDGSLRARENVVHEAGLFQGRLGFERAILLLEEGCQEFSNINGLGQIRFPKGNIKAIFEEIRRVLEREEMVDTVAASK